MRASRTAHAWAVPSSESPPRRKAPRTASWRRVIVDLLLVVNIGASVDVYKLVQPRASGSTRKGTDMTTRLLAALAATTLGAALVQAPLATAGAAPLPTCSGEVATIFFPSTSNSATAVEGTSGDDVIVTGRGSDHVDGRGGRDVICTRGGVDVIRGGKGDDLMRGGRAADQVAGGRGLDRANGGRAPKTSVQPSGRGVASATSAEIQPGGQSSDRLSSCPGLVRVGVHANEYTAELGVARASVDPAAAVVGHLLADTLVVDVLCLEAAANRGVVSGDASIVRANRPGLRCRTRRRSAMARRSQVARRLDRGCGVVLAGEVP